MPSLNGSRLGVCQGSGIGLLEGSLGRMLLSDGQVQVENKVFDRAVGVSE